MMRSHIRMFMSLLVLLASVASTAQAQETAAIATRVDSLAAQTAALDAAATSSRTTDSGEASEQPRVEAAEGQVPASLPIIVGGQVRPRYESRSGGSSDAFTSMRVRASITASLDRNVRVFMQFQDVRLFGEEANTLGDFRADNLDLHQGYLEASQIGGQSVTARVGRQAVSLGGQRLIGAVEWTQQGRVFDGARVTLGSKAKLEIVGMRLAEATASTIEDNASLFGAYATLPWGGLGAVDIYGLHQRVSSVSETAQTTMGARWHGSRNDISYRVEGSYQAGQRAGADVSAYMLAARIGTTIAQGKASVTAWYDYLSGDDAADAEVQSFSTLFATNHKYYGYADLFLNIPVHTGSHGLQDFAIKLSANAGDRIKVGLDLHSFHAAAGGVLSSTHFADEADFSINYRFSSQLSIVSGFSYVVARDGFAEIGRLTENQSFTFLMTNVAF